MKRKSDIIRPGDKVRIVQPRLFLRCGYPLTLEDTLQRVVRDWGEPIAQFLQGLGFVSDTGRMEYEISKALAYGIMRKEGFGGRERTIYTRDEPLLGGKIGEVRAIARCRTGTYIPGKVTYSGLEQEKEYEPPYLEDAQTHTILRLRVDDWTAPVDIESIHVTKILPGE